MALVQWCNGFVFFSMNCTSNYLSIYSAIVIACPAATQLHTTRGLATSHYVSGWFALFVLFNLVRGCCIKSWQFGGVDSTSSNFFLSPAPISLLHKNLVPGGPKRFERAFSLHVPWNLAFVALLSNFFLTRSVS
jgi:hypothetical protein